MHRVFLGILIALFFSLACKNPFTTRKPETPETEHQGQWEFPSTPELALKNLYWAYNEKQINNYISCLADSYRFVSSYTDSALYPDIFSDWGIEKELNATRGLFSVDTLVLSLSYDSSRRDIITQTSAVMFRRYIIVAIPSHTAPSSSPATGKAIFYLAPNEEGKWLIYLQKDEPENKSWASLKREFL